MILLRNLLIHTVNVLLKHTTEKLLNLRAETKQQQNEFLSFIRYQKVRTTILKTV